MLYKINGDVIMKRIMRFLWLIFKDILLYCVPISILLFVVIIHIDALLYITIFSSIIFVLFLIFIYLRNVWYRTRPKIKGKWIDIKEEDLDAMYDINAINYLTKLSCENLNK